MSNAVAFLTTIFPSNEPYLNDFFDSLENQTYSKFDVVIVNDGYGSIEKLKISYPRLKLVNLPFSDTPAKNREYGINYCVDNGYDVLIFGDSDDYFDKKRVEVSINLLEKYDIVVNDLSLFDESGKYNDLYISSRINNNREIDIDFIRDKNIFGLSNTALKTKILNKVIFDEDLVAVDWYLFSILLLSGCSAIFTSNTITFYRQHQLNTVGFSSAPVNSDSVRQKHYSLLRQVDSSYDILYHNEMLRGGMAQEMRHDEKVTSMTLKIHYGGNNQILKVKRRETNKNKEVFNFCKPYIIAELGSNHNGNMELAKKLIIEAKEAGVDCVKFQSWSKDTIFARKKYEDNYFIADDYRNRTDYTLEEIVDAYSISEEELLAMKKFADDIGIDCTSTPFSKKEADFLVEKLDTPFIKVASMDLNNYPFLAYLAKKNKPMVIATGLSELYEIDKAIKTIENTGNKQIIILHCVSTYPPEDKDVNLNNIKTLMGAYPEYPVGFSDHTLGTAVPLASVALGACLIEKHFTLDKNMEGWDHKVSATKEEMREIVENSKRIFEAMGSFRITATESDEKKKEFRRSIVLTRKMNAGEVILSEDIDYKRPGSGFDPGMAEYIIGRRINKDLAFDHILTKEDLV